MNKKEIDKKIKRVERLIFGDGTGIMDLVDSRFKSEMKQFVAQYKKSFSLNSIDTKKFNEDYLKIIRNFYYKI